MQEYSEAELTLRDLVDILKRHRWLLVGLPVVFGILAVVYGFFIAKPTYASTATISVSPLQVQAQLERRIQVQQSPLLTFDGLRAIAFSEDVLQEVWDGLNQAGKLPDAWQDQGKLRGIERMSKAFAMKDRTGRQNLVPQGQVPPLVAAMTVKAEDPELAAEAANLWAGATIRRVNEIPLKRLRASLVALEAQIGPAEKAYREAQARWEEFNRTTTLAQDRAELNAKTEERVALDKELSTLERDLAAVEGRVETFTAEVQKQAKIIPVDTSPDQITIMNLELDPAKARLKEETDKARASFLSAAKALEAFKKQERIPEWQAELSAYTKGYASARARILAIDKELATQRRLLEDAQARLGEYRGQIAGLNLEKLIAGMKVSEAKKLLADRLAEADDRYRRAEANYRAFQKQSALALLQAKLKDFTAEASKVSLRLETLLTERTVKAARLQALEDALAKEPKLLTLEREVAADPVALAATLKAGGLEALVGLKLKNQVLNPTHLDVLGKVLGLRADLIALDKEAAALREESDRLQAEIDRLKDEIAALETEKARVLAELEVARDQYNAVYRFYQNVLTLASQVVDAKTLREVNPDVLAFRDKVVNIESKIAGLEAEKAALLRNVTEYLVRIADLRGKIAAQEQEKESVNLEYASKKKLYQTLSFRYDQLAQLDAPFLVFDNPNPEYQRLRSVLIDAEAERARLLARKEALLKRIDQVDARIAELKARVAKAQVEADQVNQTLDLAKNTYLALSQKQTDLQIELASSQNALAQIVAPAYPIFEKVAPKRGLMLVLAVILGFFIAVFWAFIRAALEPEVPPKAAAGGR